jgi:hypothetical protein
MTSKADKKAPKEEPKVTSEYQDAPDKPDPATVAQVQVVESK